MSRIFSVGKTKGLGQSICRKQTTICSEQARKLELIGKGVCSRCRFYGQYVSNTIGHASSIAHRMRNTFHGSYSVTSPGTAVRNHAEIGWKKLSCKSFVERQTFISLSRFAQALSLALSRSYVILPSFLALAYGRNIVLAQAPSELEYGRLPMTSFYRHAEDGHFLVTLLMHSMFEGFVLLLRAFYLGILFSPSIVMAPFADAFGPSFRKLWLQIVRNTLERAGPAFIKWDQWAATRPDLFPKDLCTELSKLHTKAPEHSFAYTKKTIKKAFGREISEIFDEFEKKPLASGSIAQVHRASLLYQYRGRQIKPITVAVKVRHPGVGESIRRDFQIINLVAKISKCIPKLKWLRLDESVQQFAVFMMSQVDLAREAAHLSRFIYNFRRWKDVSFPKPVYPLVHPAVLVETFEQGECVSYYVDELEGHARLKSALAHIGTHALLKMLLVDNFIHADMHPGNILVRVTQSKSSRKRIFKSKPHVVFLDVGMTAELSNNDRIILLEFFKAIACRDGQTVAECTLQLSKKQNCPNPEAFIKEKNWTSTYEVSGSNPTRHKKTQKHQEVKESFDFWGTPEGDLVHPADCIEQLLEKVRRHRVNIDGNVCTVMVTTLVLEGWQRKLDPDYDVMSTLQKLLLKSDWAESLSYTIEGLMAP